VEPLSQPGFVKKTGERKTPGRPSIWPLWMAGSGDMVRKTDSEEKLRTAREEINERLQEALDGLRKNVTRVEIWATALGSFTQSVPDYSPNKKFELGQDNDAENPTANETALPANSDRKRR
jgi:hypothetical protein